MSSQDQPAGGTTERGATPSDRWHEALPVIRVPGATLREPRPADAPSLFAHLATRDVARFMSTPPGSPEGFERFIAWIRNERRAGRGLCFAIVPDSHGQGVGLIQVREIEPTLSTAEWGFALGQAFWGTGLFFECSSAVVDFMFRHAGTHRLEARASSENGRGNGALRKLGAVPEGVLRRAFGGEAGETDQVLWAMLEDDWLPRHPEPPCQYDWPAPEARDLAVAPAVASPGSVRAAWRDGLPELTGSRVRLRELRVDDAGPLVAMLSNDDVNRYTFPAPSSREGFERFIAWTHQRRDEGRYAAFGIVPPDREHAVGVIQIRQLEPRFRTAEWGFAIGVPYWGTGLFIEAAGLALAFIFGALHTHRLEARTAEINGRANGVLGKLGATREGRLRRSFLLGGEYQDDVLWALLADDWRRRVAA